MAGRATKPRVSPWRVLLLALGAGLLFLSVPSCQTQPSYRFTVGKCATCKGSGTFGRQSCPTCSGMGFIRVHYSYPVIDPVK